MNKIKIIDHEFIAEKVKIDFALLLDKLMKSHNMTKAELAKSANKKPSYITRVMGGDCNLTIETMSEILAAMGEELEISARRILIDEYSLLLTHLTSHRASVENTHISIESPITSSEWVTFQNKSLGLRLSRSEIK